MSEPREDAGEFAGVPDEFQRLWTPHRMAYIQAGPEPLVEVCPFCAAPETSDEDALIVPRGVHAYVLDSDLADVTGLTPDGAEWHTYLHEGTAREFGAPELDQSADEVTQLAVAWSAEAGLAADAEAVRAALDAHNVFAEETLGALIKALGLRAAA